MSARFSRREFLKLLALLPPSLYLSGPELGRLSALQSLTAQNIMIVVFDALSATNISLYGYPRDTMPNLGRLADRATVYHNHYAAGNFTTPGVASMLTGAYPWTHRSVQLGGELPSDWAHRNVFNLMDGYFRIAYSHNNFVNTHFRAMREDIDFIMPQKQLFASNALAFDRLFPWESDIAGLAWDRAVNTGERGSSYSLFMPRLYETYNERNAARLKELFPQGVPRVGADDYFLLEAGVDWLRSQLPGVDQPFFGYFHFLPPHEPYCPRRDFLGAFKDDGVGHYVEKPVHPYFNLSGDRPRQVFLENQGQQRELYDEFVLYADGELGRLIDFMEESGLIENTWLIVTSDHGELFERGIIGHRTETLYEPVLRVPLLICEPGRRQRRDVYETTSAVDLLPTLLKVAGRPVPEWAEGEILPPFAEMPPDAARGIFAVEAKFSTPGGPLYPATAMVLKDGYKLTAFLGYQEQVGAPEYFELYDLRSDPEELNNLYSAQPQIARPLRDQLLERLRAADQPYLHG